MKIQKTKNIEKEKNVDITSTDVNNYVITAIIKIVC